MYLPDHIPRKTKFIGVRIDKELAEKIFKAAEDAHITVSEFVREKMDNLKIPNLPDLKALGDLRKIRNSLTDHGNKIKEIAAAHESTAEIKSQLAQEVIEYGRIGRQIEAVAKIFDVYFDDDPRYALEVTEDKSIADVDALMDKDAQNYFEENENPPS